MNVDVEKCIGCGFCVRDCPVEAVHLVKKKAVIKDHCTQCGACLKV
ncbi:MAG: 4Fe-4S binding protein, partial [Deltaproteobacteria bacterium]|nr:4Fe-4S binding protein [Deltaproteobacteria bacterium]